MMRIVLQLLNVVLNLCIIKNYIVASHLIVFFLFIFWHGHLSITLETLDKICAILEIYLISFKAIGGKK